MIRINLLAIERAGTKRRPAGFQLAQKITVACSLILVATLLGIGWWYWSLTDRATRLKDDIAAAQAETARLRQVMLQVQEYEQRRAQLQQRVSLIEDLRKVQSGPVRILDQISRALPDMLWLTEIKQQGNDLTISGRCLTLTALSDFVSNLEASGSFKRPVEIADSQAEPSQRAGAETVIKFSVKAQFAPPAASSAP
jgi:type IV pilus assembly protein PilN